MTSLANSQLGQGRQRMILVVGAVVLAISAAAIGVTLGEMSRRYLLVASGLVGWGALGLLIGDVRAAFLFLLPTAIAYNRQFYSFDNWIGDYGYAGLYWVPADALIMLLVVITLWRNLNGQNKEAVYQCSGVLVPFFLLLMAMITSAVASNQTIPALIESARLTKLFIILLFLLSIMTVRNATALLLGLAAMIGMQTALGVVQFGLGAGGAGLSSLSAQAGEMARRATGTLGHPNFYAPFLLTVVPGFVAMALGMRNNWVRGVAFLVAGSGMIGILVSQSRMAVAALVLALIATALHLVVRRFVSPLRMIGCMAVACVLLVFMALPLAGPIYDRLTGDLDASISFRTDYNRAALEMWEMRPLLGQGPNQFVAELGPYSSELKYINDQLEQYRTEANVRTAAPVHNVYLLILSELGVIGAAAFAVVIFACAKEFLLAASGQPERPASLLFLGVFWGFLAVLLQQITDFSLWWDHHLYLLVVLLALAAHVRAVLPSRQARVR